MSSYVSYRSFAYITIKDRLPVILTKIIDTLCRNKENIAEIYGEVKHTFEDLKIHLIESSDLCITSITFKLFRMPQKKLNK